MTEPNDDKPESGPAFPRWAVYVLVPGLVLPVLILGFIFVSELSHDERRCPYSRVSTQALAGGVRVREDRRRCMSNVEERRYTALRGDGETLIGRRRFSPAAFEQGAYRWVAKLGDDGQVHIDVHNAGHADATFREGTAAERAE